MKPTIKILTHLIINVKRSRFLLSLGFIFVVYVSNAQVVTGVFGGQHPDGLHYSQSQESWIKLAEMHLTGSHAAAGFTMDLYPRNSNHGDSRQQVSVQFRNLSNGSLYQSTYDIVLFHMHGGHKIIKDIKVVQTQDSQVDGNKLSVWVQVGISWLRSVPIEVRQYTQGAQIEVYTSHQPLYENIAETGTIYNLKTYFGMSDDQFEVSGTIRAKELALEASPWPDYVFEEGYALQPLDTVEYYIKKYGHLPNIPSAAEVEKEGVKVGQMNAKLLEKIEELTLHTINQQKLIETLLKENDTLKAKQPNYDALLERIEKLENQK